MVGMVLIVTLAFSFSACGSNDADTANSKNKGGDQAVEDTNEYVYVPEAFPLEGLEWIGAACQYQDGLYLISPFADEETWTTGTQGYYLDASGELTKLPLGTENTEAAFISVDALGALSDGSLVYIESERPINDEDLQTKGQRFFLVHASAEGGEELSRVDITEQMQFKDGNSKAFLRFLKVDKKDQIYVSDGNNIWVFDVSGKLAYQVATDKNGWIQDMGVTKEGQVVYSGWDSVAGGICLFVIDETSGTATPCKENVPESAGVGIGMIPGAEKGVVVNTVSGLVEYDTETQTGRPILNWADSGLSVDSIAALALLADGNILAVTMEQPTESQGAFTFQTVLLRKTLASEVKKQEREIVTLGVFWENQDLLRAVTNFNQSQEAYQIETVNYGENGDLDAAFTRFTNELTAGTGPDIFDSSRLNLNLLAKKGVLEELTPYLEADAEVKREDFFESVLKAYSVDGNLYTIPNSFSVFGMAGSNAYLADYGSGYEWTLQDMMKLAEKNPEKEMFGYGSKNYMLLTCLRYNYQQFIDLKSGECHLDSDAFIALLTFANTFKNQYEEDAEYTITEKMQNGTVMADEVCLSSIQDEQKLQALFGGDFLLKGFPTDEGEGLAVQGNNVLVINAGSKHKDAAWEFMRSLLTKEYYETEKVTGFPTLISAYNQINEEYMTPDYTQDENGEQTEESKGSYSEGSFFVEYRTSTKEEAEWMTDVIAHCDRTFMGDTQIENIVMEEAAAFFSGQKSVEETAEIIQNRVKIYVNENM